MLNTALVTAQSGLLPDEARADREFRGRLVESAVGAHLANAAACGACELFYWREQSREVDFVVRTGRTVLAIEVKSGRAPDAFPRRGTHRASSISRSPARQTVGAHMNPAVTLTFLRLGKVAPHDPAGYIAAQFAGIAGIAAATVLLGSLLSSPPVNYVATVPGSGGEAVAFAAETVISFVMMTMVLHVSNTPRAWLVLLARRPVFSWRPTSSSNRRPRA